MRFHDHQRAGDFRNLAEVEEASGVVGGGCLGFGRQRTDRLDHYDIAGFNNVGGATWVRPEAAIIVPRPRPTHRGNRDAAARPIGKADCGAIRFAADDHGEAPAYIGRDPRQRYFGEVRCPVTLWIDADHRSAPSTVTAFIADQPTAQSLIRSRLQPRIEAGMYR